MVSKFRVNSVAATSLDIVTFAVPPPPNVYILEVYDTVPLLPPVLNSNVVMSSSSGSGAHGLWSWNGLGEVVCDVLGEGNIKGGLVERDCVFASTCYELTLFVERGGIFSLSRQIRYCMMDIEDRRVPDPIRVHKRDSRLCRLRFVAS